MSNLTSHLETAEQKEKESHQKGVGSKNSTKKKSMTQKIGSLGKINKIEKLFSILSKGRERFKLPKLEMKGGVSQ